MAETFYIKRNDTAPILTQTLTDAAGEAIDLTGATVNFHVNNRRGVNVIDAGMTILNATAGIVTYTFGVIAAGNYEFEVEATMADTSVETFPNAGFDILIVERDLA